MKSRILRRAARNHFAVGDANKANRNGAKFAPVEHLFASQQTALGGRNVRMIGFVRERVKIGLLNLASNFAAL